MRIIRFGLFLATLGFVIASPRAQAAIFNIPAGDGTALRQAITDANANSEADTINLTFAAGQPYTFTTAVEGNQALPSITTEMTIVGNGAIIERADSSIEDMRILRLAFNANLTLQNVTIQGGFLSGVGIAGAGILVTSGQLTIEGSTLNRNICIDGTGGGLYTASQPVVIRDSTISENVATLGGGIGVFGPGAVTLERTIVRNNTARTGSDGTPATGAGIFLKNGGVLTMTESTVRANKARATDGTSRGGGIGADEGFATIDRTTFALNEAQTTGLGDALGGGIFAIGNGTSFTISNSTITGNRTTTEAAALEDGAGIYLKGVNSVWSLLNVTIASNNTIVEDFGPSERRTRGGVIGKRGGGIFLGNPGSLGTDSFTLSNTIVGDNLGATGVDCFTESGKSILSTGNNLITSTANCTLTSQPSDLTGQSPLLGPLADNGGPTQTMALLTGSPAINAGSEAAAGTAGACPSIDQRIFGRPAGGRCDIGAYEKDGVDVSGTTTTTVTASTTTTTLSGECGVPAPTFESIKCRLRALIAEVDASSNLGKFKKGLLAGAKFALVRTESGEELQTRGKTKTAKKKLKQAGRKMLSFAHRLKSNNAKKSLAAEIREPLAAKATALQGDLKTLGAGL